MNVFRWTKRPTGDVGADLGVPHDAVGHPDRVGRHANRVDRPPVADADPVAELVALRDGTVPIRVRLLKRHQLLRVRHTQPPRRRLLM
mgnify:FL=1